MSIEKHRVERPKAGEDEEHLLKMQHDFMALSASQSPACHAVEKRKSLPKFNDGYHDGDKITDSTVQSNFAKKLRYQSGQKDSETKLDGESDTANHKLSPPDCTVFNGESRHAVAVLGDIVERDTESSSVSWPALSTEPFPVASRRQHIDSIGDRKQSIFARQMLLQQESNSCQDFADGCSSTLSVVRRVQAAQSGSDTAPCDASKPVANEVAEHGLVEGAGLSATDAEMEADSIHEENLKMLSQLSMEEILEQQRQLRSVLDPSVVAFIQSKCRKAGATHDGEHCEPSGIESVTPLIHKPERNTGSSDGVHILNQGQWLNMNVVEDKKMEWMKDLSPLTTNIANSQKPARFDFRGNVIPVTADLPTHLALHHHGEEPERAGYTVNELFHLARSSAHQQRVLALSTLASIITKAKEGALDEVIESPLIPSILDGGIVFLLRVAADDPADSVSSASIAALRALLYKEADEAALDKVAVWYQGHLSPSFAPLNSAVSGNELPRQSEDGSNSTETDADVARRDVIECLVYRMRLVNRLTYILDVHHPQANTVVAILQILTRVVRHSQQVAYEVSRNVPLMGLIFKNFLPSFLPTEAENHEEVSNVYGRPVAAAMRLVNCLCQAGRHIASTLMIDYGMKSILLCYLAGLSQDVPVHGCSDSVVRLLPIEHGQLLRESLRAWTTLLRYGFASDIYMMMFGSLIGWLHRICSQGASLSNHSPTAVDVLLVSTLDALLSVAAFPPGNTPGFNTGESVTCGNVAPTPVTWNKVEGLLPVMTLCVKQSLKAISCHPLPNNYDYQFVIAGLNFMATFYDPSSCQVVAGPLDRLQGTELFCSDCLLPFLASNGFTTILSTLCCGSNLLSPTTTREKERLMSPALPDLLGNGSATIVPVLAESSPVGFLRSLTRLCYSLCTLHKGMAAQVAGAVLGHADLVWYLRKVTAVGCLNRLRDPFTRFENAFHFSLLELSVLSDLDVGLRQLLHMVALILLSRLQDGDEHVAHELMSAVIFNSKFFVEASDVSVTSAISDIKVKASDLFGNATLEEICVNDTQLLKNGFDLLADARGIYSNCFFCTEERITMSWCGFPRRPYDTQALTWRRCNQMLMPGDWVFMPLVLLYNSHSTTSISDPQCLLSRPVAMVTCVLSWIFLLEKFRPESLAHVSVTLKLSRVMCVFLAGNSLFLERSVAAYLVALFRVYTTSRCLDKMNFEDTIPGISSFYDLYMDFLDQYQSVSYGDAVFGMYVILPLQQTQNALLRQAVWQERCYLLQWMSLPLKQVLLDINLFLVPEEQDQRLLHLYLQSVLSGAVRRRRAPFFFLLAVHHVNRFLYHHGDHQHDEQRRTFWRCVLRCPKKDVAQTIITYKQFSRQSDDGIEKYSVLPPSRQALLDLQLSSQHQPAS